MNEPLTEILPCPDCGALTLAQDADQHRDWHANLNTTVHNAAWNYDTTPKVRDPEPSRRDIASMGGDPSL